MRKHGSFKAIAGVLAVLLGGSLAHAAPGDVSHTLMPPVTNAPDQPAGTFHYMWLAGSTFHKFGDVTEFSYSGNGCINATGGTEKRLQHKVLLPQGATVEYLRLYAYDDSASNITAFFTSYDAAGNFTEHTYVSSTDAGGYVNVLSPSISHVVDSFVSPMNVTVHLGDESSADTIFKNGFGDSFNLRFCGVRISYTP